MFVKLWAYSTYMFEHGNDVDNKKLTELEGCSEEAGDYTFKFDDEDGGTETASLRHQRINEFDAVIGGKDGWFKVVTKSDEFVVRGDSIEEVIKKLSIPPVLNRLRG